MLSSIICIYLGSKIFNGTVVFGKIIKFERGKTGIFFGRSLFNIIDIYLRFNYIVLHLNISMKENKLNFDRLKIFNLFQDKKYAKISKISKSILKTFAQDKEIYKIIIFSELNEKNFNKAKIISNLILSLQAFLKKIYLIH